MCPDKQRLQVRHSELFEFRNLTKEWLDIFVRWFLNEPLAKPSSSPFEMGVTEQQPESSDDANEALTDTASDSDTSLLDGPRSPEKVITSQKPIVKPLRSSGCNSKGTSLHQTLALRPILLNAQ